MKAIASLNAAFTRAWLWFGLPILLAVFAAVLLHAWTGKFDPYLYTYGNIGGFIPHSDNQSYFQETFQVGFNGRWGEMSSRRPMAAPLRQLLALASGYSYVYSAWIQSALIAVMLWLCSYRLMLWRGIIAGLVFCFLTVMLAEPFVGTYLTEPIGLLWSLASIIFLIEAVRREHVALGLLAFGALTIAMWTRMGALFMIPAVALWLVLCFGARIRERLRIAGLAALVIAAPIGLSQGFSYAYGDPRVTIGNNFAFVICGLSLGPGKTWRDCYNSYRNEMEAAPSERAQGEIALTHAKENFLAAPSPALDAVLYNSASFWRGLPNFFVNGYKDRHLVDSGAIMWASVAFVVLLLVYAFRASWTERLFWGLTVPAVWFSAMLIMADDGWRVLQVSHAFLALLIACAIGAPAAAVAASPTDLSIRRCVAIVGLVLLMMAGAPALSYALFGAERDLRAELPSGESQEVLFGGRRITGVLVVPDGEPTGFGTISRSKFDQLIRSAWLETDFGPIIDRLPQDRRFAFIAGAVLNRGSWIYTRTYIAPPEALDPHKRLLILEMAEPPGSDDTIRFVERLTAR